MKLKITLKDPDGVSDSIDDAAKASVSQAEGLDSREIEGLIECWRDRIAEKSSPWIRYGEYVTIEIDTDAGTAIVCKV